MTDSTDIEKDNGLNAVSDALRVLFRLIKVVMLLLVIGFLCSGISYNEQYEKSIVLRLGEVKGPVRDQPGWIFALPFPIDEVIKIHGKFQTYETSTYWYAESTKQTDDGKPLIAPTLKPGSDGYLLTADNSIIHAKAVLKYRVSDPKHFQFDHNNIEKTLQALLDNALLKACSTINTKNGLPQSQLSFAATRILKDSISDQKLGIEIDPVELKLIWPRQIQDSIETVVRSSQTAQQKIAEANIFANNQINEAESQAAEIKANAQIHATRTISRSEADAQAFRKLYPLYKQNKDVIRETLYQNRIRKILSNVEETFIVEDKSNREIRLNLKRQTEGRKSIIDNSEIMDERKADDKIGWPTGSSLAWYSSSTHSSALS